ncbi:MAG: DUF2530 domain-containing protein [Sciscionella sp.]
MTDRGEAEQVQPLPPPPPLPKGLVDLRPVSWVGTGLWFAGFCVLLVARLAFHAGAPIVLWTCLAGWLLGLLGLSVSWWQRSAARRGSRSAQTGF